MRACVYYSSFSICILLYCLYKNSSISVPKSTPDYNSLNMDPETFMEHNKSER